MIFKKSKSFACNHNQKLSSPLCDIAHNILPDLRKYYYIADALVTTTILPDPSQMCDEKKFKGIFGSCNNLIFSGLIAIVLTPRFSKTQCYLLYAYIVATIFIILAARNHYTIDVIMAFLHDLQ